MIGIVPDKPEITGKLAVSAARVLRDYCKKFEDCEHCGIEDWCKDTGMVVLPCSWDLPEE